MAFARLLMGSLLIAGVLAIAPVAVAQDEGGGPGKGPFYQDPGGGFPSGGDPCSISQRGSCRYMTIYPGAFPCQAAWCEADPAANWTCAGYNTQTCYLGDDTEGNEIYVMINNCMTCSYVP